MKFFAFAHVYDLLRFGPAPVIAIHTRKSVSQGLRKQFISAFTDGFFCIFLYSGRRAVYQVHAAFRTSKYPPNLCILLY